jgi:hypothetical protein
MPPGVGCQISKSQNHKPLSTPPRLHAHSRRTASFRTSFVSVESIEPGPCRPSTAPQARAQITRVLLERCLPAIPPSLFCLSTLPHPTQHLTKAQGKEKEKQSKAAMSWTHVRFETSVVSREGGRGKEERGAGRQCREIDDDGLGDSCLMHNPLKTTGQLHPGALLPTRPADMSQFCWYVIFPLSLNPPSHPPSLPPSLPPYRTRPLRLLQRHNFPSHHKGRWERRRAYIAGDEAGRKDMRGCVPIPHSYSPSLPSLPPSLPPSVRPCTGFHDSGRGSHGHRAWRRIYLRVSSGF